MFDKTEVVISVIMKNETEPIPEKSFVYLRWSL